MSGTWSSEPDSSSLSVVVAADRRGFGVEVRRRSTRVFHVLISGGLTSQGVSKAQQDKSGVCTELGRSRRVKFIIVVNL